MTNMLMLGDFVRVAYLDRPEQFGGSVRKAEDQFVWIENHNNAQLLMFECMNGQFWLDDQTDRICTIEVISLDQLILESTAKAQAWMFDRLAEAMGVDL